MIEKRVREVPKHTLKRHQAKRKGRHTVCSESEENKLVQDFLYMEKYMFS